MRGTQGLNPKLNLSVLEDVLRCTRMFFRPSVPPTPGNVARAGVAPQESHRRATGGGGWVNNADTMLAAELEARMRNRGLKIEQVPL